MAESELVAEVGVAGMQDDVGHGRPRARRLVVNAWSFGSERGLHVEHRQQIVVVDLDALDGRVGDIQAVCRDRDDGVAHEAYRWICQEGLIAKRRTEGRLNV